METSVLRFVRTELVELLGMETYMVPTVRAQAEDFCADEHGQGQISQNSMRRHVLGSITVRKTMLAITKSTA